MVEARQTIEFSNGINRYITQRITIRLDVVLLRLMRLESRIVLSRLFNYAAARVSTTRRSKRQFSRIKCDIKCKFLLIVAVENFPVQFAVFTKRVFCLQKLVERKFSFVRNEVFKKRKISTTGLIKCFPKGSICNLILLYATHPVMLHQILFHSAMTNDKFQQRMEYRLSILFYPWMVNFLDRSINKKKRVLSGKWH